MAPLQSFSRRTGDLAPFFSTSKPSPIDIVGFSLVGAVFLGLSVIALCLLRKRAVRKRKDGVFLSAQGSTKGGEQTSEKQPSSKGLPSTTFSRRNITSDIVLPEKARARTAPATRRDTIRHHRESNTVRRTSIRSSIVIPTLPSLPFFRSSIFPSPRSLIGNRLSALSTTSSTASSQTPNHARVAYQLFTPLLPDELLLTCIGERFIVIQSFDDGWCLVGRKSAMTKAASGPKSLFRDDGSESDVELGVVPSWCFLKPMSGLKPERPPRGPSLECTVEASTISARKELVSWSNF